MNSISITWIIIGSTGFLGGLTNFLMSHDNSLSIKDNWIKFFASVCLSLCASISVPLFLHTLSNSILVNLADPTNILIFSGFCILASVFSKRYLEDLYSKVKSLEKKAAKDKSEINNELQDSQRKTEKVNKKLQDLEESIEQIDDNLPSEIHQAIAANPKLSFTPVEVENIIKELLSPKYSFRTVEGIAKEVEIEVDKINEVMIHLRELGFAESKIGQNGKRFWWILKYPIRIYSAVYGVPGKNTDVTDKIAELVSKEKFEITAAHSFLGITDPAPGIGKQLKIHYRVHGKEREANLNEGETFKLQ